MSHRKQDPNTVLSRSAGAFFHIGMAKIYAEATLKTLRAVDRSASKYFLFSIYAALDRLVNRLQLYKNLGGRPPYTPS